MNDVMAGCLGLKGGIPKTIPWYARQIKDAVGFPHTTEQMLTMCQVASILTRWLTGEVPHGTTKRRIKNLYKLAAIAALAACKEKGK